MGPRVCVCVCCTSIQMRQSPTYKVEKNVHTRKLFLDENNWIEFQKKKLQVPRLLMGNEQRVAVKQSGTVGLSRLSPAMSLPAHNMGKGKRSKNRQPKRRKRKRETLRRTPRSLEVSLSLSLDDGSGLARRFCRLRFFSSSSSSSPFLTFSSLVVDGGPLDVWWLASPSFLSFHPLLEPAYLFRLYTCASQEEE